MDAGYFADTSKARYPTANESYSELYAGHLYQKIARLLGLVQLLAFAFQTQCALG